MFKRRHSYPIINNKSNAHSNQYGKLIDKDDKEYEEYEHKEKNTPTKWKEPNKRDTKDDNKYHVDNVSLEDMDEVIRPYSHDIQEVTRDGETCKEYKECEDMKEAYGHLLGEFNRMEEYCVNVRGAEMKEEVKTKDENKIFEQLEENYEVELVTNDALTSLVESLNNDHIQAQDKSNKIIKSLRYDIIIKKDRMKKELDTVRSLNDNFRNQINKGVMEKKKLASKKKEIEKECKEMKSKTTSLEAQLMMLQETLEQKEEVQRLCDQYLSKIQDYKKQLSDKDLDIKKLTKEQEIDKTKLAKLTKECDEVKIQNEELEFRVAHADLLSPEQQKSYGEIFRARLKEKEQNRQRSRYKKGQRDR